MFDPFGVRVRFWGLVVGGEIFDDSASVLTLTLAFFMVPHGHQMGWFFFRLVDLLASHGAWMDACGQIVLATNIAETSITIDDVTFVVRIVGCAASYFIIIIYIHMGVSIFNALYMCVCVCVCRACAPPSPSMTSPSW